MDRVQRTIGTLVGGLGLLIGIWLNLSGDPELERLGLTLFLGLVVGALFQRSRFCMFCLLRDGWLHRNGRPLLGLLACIGVGSVGYTLIFGAWVPDPSLPDYLPPNAFIGPVGWHLAVGGLLFGAGMALSGSCISSHLYRLGEGAAGSMVSLLFAVPGFALGYLSWDFWYTHFIREAPVIWLPRHLGYPGALALQLALLAALAILLLHLDRQALTRFWQRTRSWSEVLRQVAFGRWPIVLSGAVLGLIAVALYFRLRPLGVTSELSRMGRDVALGLGLLPDRPLAGLDRVRGCTPQEAPALLSENAVLLLALVGGSLAATLIAARFRFQAPKLRQLPTLALGGLLLGYGAFVSLGCNIGTLVSGTMALSLSGWVFALFLGLGLFGVLALTPPATVSKRGCSVPLVSLHRVPDLRSRPQGKSPPGFLSPAELWNEIRSGTESVQILETGRNPDSFEFGHVPTARWFDYREVFSPTAGFSGLFPGSWERLAPPGVLPRLTVIYDVSGGFRAARLAVALSLAGWKDVAVLDGGLQGWAGSGYPVERGWGRVSLPLGSERVPRPERLRVVTAQDILHRNADCAVWDTRPEPAPHEDANGLRMSIPGAHALPWSQVLEPQKVFLKDAESLRRLFAPYLGGEVRSVYLFCQTGERSSLVAWLLYHLYPTLTVGLYDHSWEEWGRSPDLPQAPLVK